MSVAVNSVAEKKMEIRAEERRDIASIRALNEVAFGACTEANLVDALRDQSEEFISLVAEEDRSVIGHIFFSRVTHITHPTLKIMGLAPMAVIPARQRMGVGSALVRAGLAKCKKIRSGAVIVLGHPEYYPRFGFGPASRFGIRCEYEVPDEVFMALELEVGILRDKPGTIRYHPAFANT